jgi:translation initiation factor IF-2
MEQLKQEPGQDQPTQVIEKRLSKGVIRRRVKVEAPVPQPVVETPKPSVPVVTAAPVEVPKPKAEEVPTEQPSVAISEATPEEKTEVSAAKVEAKAAPVVETAVAPLLKTPPEAEKPPEQPVLVKKAAATQVGEEIVKDMDVAKAKAAKKEESERRPLTFQERLRGTISLDKLRIRPPVKKVGPAGTATAGATVPETEEEAAKKAEQAKKDKAAKNKKSVKVIGGDLDIDGGGKSTTLTHLVRTGAVDRVFRPDALGRKKKIISKKRIKQPSLIEKKASKRVIEIQGAISVRDFAQQLGVKAGEIIKKLMDLGTMVTLNQSIDQDTATLVAQEYQYEVRDVSFKESEVLGKPVAEAEVVDEGALPRPPVVTVMGHVDHGKTSLLDAIRSTNVTEGEAGGITQHIGAYTVTLPQGNITFLDTPGHEAFSAMRARGAKATDIVVLVVAADDGVMPQTEESISHAQAAGVPVIVAVNKIDKPEAEPDRVMRQLSERGLLAEEWGGQTMFAKVSAKKKEGVKELLEGILLQAEVLELKANPEKRAAGVVLEAKLDRFRGPVCTLLVQEGTLNVGDPVVVGTQVGKVKAMQDWRGGDIKTAGPSTAVEILGLEGVPDASDTFNAVASEQDARKVAEHRIEEKRKQDLAQGQKVSLEDLFFNKKAGEVQELNVILKTDVQGSLEAVRDALAKLGTEEVKTKLIHAGVGGIKETDVNLAATSKAVIIGFNVRPETKAIHLAKDKGVDIKLYKIIYDLVNEVKLAMQGLLAPTIKENYLGRAEVRETFQVSKMGLVAGCMVVDGTIMRSANIRLLRDNVVIHEGKIASLKRFKDDAREVKQGFECGIGIDSYQDIKSGDVLEAFEIEKIQRTL